MTSIATIRSSVAVLALVLSATGLSACAQDLGPNQYGPYESGVAAHVEEGEIVGVQPVTLDKRNTGTGAVVGGVTGGVVGSQFGGHHSDHVAGGVIGALGGALIGNAIEKSGDKVPGFAYTVRRANGELIQVAQADAQAIPVGTRVYISYGARVRIQPVNPYGPPPPPPPPPNR